MLYTEEALWSMDLDSITHGPVYGDEAQYTDKPVPRFREGWKNIKLPPPPKNSSLQTRIELQQIRDLLNEADWPKIKAQDLRFEQEFTAFLPKADQAAVQKDLDKLAEELTTISHYFKLQFNRPRPKQLFAAWNMPVKVMPSETATSPAYPSGHALIAKFFALYLTSKYPQLGPVFEELASTIGHNRIRAGLHFQSDYDAGVRLAKELFQYLRA